MEIVTVGRWLLVAGGCSWCVVEDEHWHLLNKDGTLGAVVSTEPHPDYGPCDDFRDPGCSECESIEGLVARVIKRARGDGNGDVGRVG